MGAPGWVCRAHVLAEAACQGSIPPSEPAVRLKVEALLAAGRCVCTRLARTVQRTQGVRLGRGRRFGRAEL